MKVLSIEDKKRLKEAIELQKKIMIKNLFQFYGI